MLSWHKICKRIPWSALAFCAGFVTIVSWFQINNVWEYRFDEAGFSYVIANILRILFVLYIGWIAYYIGRFLIQRFSPGIATSIASKSFLDLFIFSSFLGLSLISCLIFILGTFKLLYIWIIGPLFVVAILVLYPTFKIDYATYHKRIIASYVNRIKQEFPITKVLLLAVLFLFLSLVISKGLFSAIGTSDSLAHYLPYIDSVIEQHGIQPNKWFLHYFLMKGASLHILAALLADIQTLQTTVFYLFALSGIVLFKLLKEISKNILWPTLGLIIYFASSTVFAAEFQKQHVVIGVYAAFLFYTSIVLVKHETKTWRTLFIIQLVALIAMIYMQPMSSAVVIIPLLLTQTVLYICMKQTTLLKYSILLSIATGVVFLSLLFYNYYFTGLYEFAPADLFLDHGNPDIWTKWFSPAAFLLMREWDGGAQAMQLLTDIQSLVTSFNTEGFVPFLSSLAKSWLFIWVGFIASIMWTLISWQYSNKNKRWLPWIVSSLFAIAMLVFYPGEISAIRNFVPVSNSILALLSFVLLAIVTFYILSSKSHDLFEYNVLTSAILFLIMDSFLIRSLVVGSSPTSGLSGSASRFSFHMLFFQVLLFIIAIKVFANIFTPRKLRNDMVMLISVSMLCLVTYQFSGRAGELISSLKYLFGEMSFSDLYESAGSKYGLMIQEIVGKNNKVLMMNVCRACYGIPGSMIQAQVMTDFVADFDVVYYGKPNESMDALKRVDINYVWVDTNEQLLSVAYAPLFRLDNIKKYFEILWQSDGKYLLIWNQGIAADDGMMDQFIKDYGDRIERDRSPLNEDSDMYVLYNKAREFLDEDRFKFYTSSRIGRYFDRFGTEENGP